MNNIIIDILIIYWLIATFILLQLLFNPRYRLVWVDGKTGEKTEPPFWVIILFCLYWLFFAAYILIKIGGRKNVK